MMVVGEDGWRKGLPYSDQSSVKVSFDWLRVFQLEIRPTKRFLSFSMGLAKVQPRSLVVLHLL